MRENKLQGKTALVTGAARRIGHEIVEVLAGEGVNVVIHDRDQAAQESHKLCASLAERGVKTWPLLADFEKPEEYETLIARAKEAAGSLDILINNAAIFSPGTIGDVSFHDLVRHMQVNAWVPLVLSREFARVCGRGKIINILDTRVDGSDPSHAAYIMSKHMLALITKMTAVEFAPRITVNGVAPGLILPPPGKDESYLEGLARTVPLKRHGNPGEVTAAVLYLLKSEFVTGEIIHVDGGRHVVEYGDGQDHH